MNYISVEKLSFFGSRIYYFSFSLKVVIRPMMYIALTYDHRLIDGREAVTFLRKVKAGVEDPRIILAGV
jgi:pyruvate/2-oxoglutarate dehydrogenase complex dihydrolipoamide acyltransferase (E2) component